MLNDYCFLRWRYIFLSCLFEFWTDQSLMLTTDEFLPMMIYLIIKSEIPNWYLFSFIHSNIWSYCSINVIDSYYWQVFKGRIPNFGVHFYNKHLEFLVSCFSPWAHNYWGWINADFHLEHVGIILLHFKCVKCVFACVICVCVCVCICIVCIFFETLTILWTIFSSRMANLRYMKEFNFSKAYNFDEFMWVHNILF